MTKIVVISQQANHGHLCSNQARNQLGRPRGAMSFLRGTQIFLTMSNSFKPCPTHFYRGEKIF